RKWEKPHLDGITRDAIALHRVTKMQKYGDVEIGIIKSITTKLVLLYEVNQCRLQFKVVNLYSRPNYATATASSSGNSEISQSLSLISFFSYINRSFFKNFLRRDFVSLILKLGLLPKFAQGLLNPRIKFQDLFVLVALHTQVTKQTNQVGASDVKVKEIPSEKRERKRV
ncbi:hypothetical protein PIB30_090494, partial [Stylosanthes scabra]|nr:hypothetical protein [Stylosanthes scabra]